MTATIADRRRRRWLVAATAVAPSVWGTTYLLATEVLPPGRPLLAAVMRALPAGLLLVAATGVLPRGAWWWRAMVLGAANIGIFFALLFVAAYRLPGGVAATMGALQPLIVIGLGAVLLGTVTTRRHLAAAVGGIAGVGLLVLRGDAALDAVGILAALGGAVSMAIGVVLTKRWGRPVSVLAFTGWQLVAGGVLLLPVLLAVEGVPPAPTGGQLAGFAYMAVLGTVVAYALWFRGIEQLPATSVSFLGLLSPVVATLLGWVVLGQDLGGWQLLGVALTLASILSAQVVRPRAAKASAALHVPSTAGPPSSPSRASDADILT